MEVEKKIAEEVVGLSKDIYADVAKPILSEVGKTGGGITRILLSPLNGLVWGFDKIVENLDNTISEKLNKVSEAKLQTPPPFVAVPSLEAMRYTGEVEELRNLYANLLANSMDMDTIENVHPGFVDIIKNLTPDEAKLLTVFLRVESLPFIDVKQVDDKIQRSFVVTIKMHTHVIDEFELELLYPCNLPVYFSNLIRIGILESPNNLSLDDQKYSELETCEYILEEKEKIEAEGKIFEVDRRFIRPTSFGYQFINTVVKDK
ncbi:DUF4393 domain-containing protein [Olivibacter sp. SDN3]|uniref:DUF4393 domain-containing protein n=1 Tax=Olivibacter sp. SDN3 TaxID=2764720 RepID=UPI0016518BE8|nr:DUF4393 domain-containing protein [Olivibacter sp. SDN3]QNL51957.1 DUF4393 domain-containing protein [Olivibacter sp. SDN3]